MTKYTLQMHSWNWGNYKHSGYSLIAEHDDGSITIKSIDFSSLEGSLGEAIIEFKEADAIKTTDIRNKDVFWAVGDIDKIQNEAVQINTLLSGDDALEVFNKIKAEAILTNIAEIQYDIVGDMRVCNTATEYWAEKYIYSNPNCLVDDVFQDMNGNFLGKDDNYIDATNYQDQTKIKFIGNLIDMLDQLGKINEFLNENQTGISSKYLSIIQSFLEKEYDFLTNNTSLLEDFLTEISNGATNLFSYKSIGTDNGSKIIPQVKEIVSTAETVRSPLVVDLDGDGIETLGTDAGVYFDHDDNGFLEKTGWVGKDDGLLVRDINNNGKIDDGTELFGDNSVLSNGVKAFNGFEALADLDTNNFLRPIVKPTSRWFKQSILTIIKNLSASERFFIMVGPDGLEPTTRPL